MNTKKLFPQVWKLVKKDGNVIIEILYKNRIEVYKRVYSESESQIKKETNKNFNMYVYDEEYYNSNGFKRVA